MVNKLVSIVSISYNQEKFIGEALESFIMQHHVGFDIEIVIGDDASTDKTQSIIAEYRKRYPKIVRPILRKKNIGVVNNLIDAMASAKGDYIALCEGDDYWTDPFKLQKQFEFMERNPNHALVFHKVKISFGKGSKKSDIYPARSNNFELEDLVRSNFIQTNSVMYRKRHRREYIALDRGIMPADWYLHLFHAQFGSVGFIDEIMSVYRRHEQGIWWASAKKDNDSILTKWGANHLRLYSEILKIYGENKKFRDIIEDYIIITLEDIAKLDYNNGTHTLKSFIEQSGIANDSSLIATMANRSYSLDKLVKK